jgi:hypothetical protein
MSNHKRNLIKEWQDGDRHIAWLSAVDEDGQETFVVCLRDSRKEETVEGLDFRLADKIWNSFVAGQEFDADFEPDDYGQLIKYHEDREAYYAKTARAYQAIPREEKYGKTPL